MKKERKIKLKPIEIENIKLLELSVIDVKDLPKGMEECVITKITGIKDEWDKDAS